MGWDYKEMNLKFKFLNTAVVCLIFSASAITNVARAGLIEETWQGTVTSSSTTSVLSIGDIATWTIQYDDSSLVMNEYTEGQDGVEGTADDTVNQIFDARCPGGSYCSQYDIFADALFNLDAFELPMLEFMRTTGEVENDFKDEHYAWRYSSVSGTNYFEMEFGSTEFRYRAGHEDVVYYKYTDKGARTIGLNEIKMLGSRSIVDVPEPSTLAILALAMIALTSRRMMKNINK